MMVVAIAMVVMVVMVVMFTVLIVVMVTVPVVVHFAIGLVLGNVMSLFAAAAHHGLLEVLGAVGMVVVFTKGPLVQQRIALVNTRLGAIGIGHGC